MHRLRPSLVAALIACAAPFAAHAQMAAPAASGARATLVTLASLGGKVVVIAFYPKDRTSGCTAEPTKFRDQCSTLFGRDVVVLPVSADSIASHVSWASEMKFNALNEESYTALATAIAHAR